MAAKFDIYQTVTDTIVAQIESGLNGKWRRPWKTISPTGGSAFPVSIDGRAYRGINVAILMLSPFGSNVWGTYKAWKRHGGQVRKGETGTLVIFWNFVKKIDEETGEEKVIPFARGYKVFNADQVEGWNEEQVAETTREQRHENAHKALRAYCDRESIAVNHGGDRAYYTPSADRIALPAEAAFDTEEDYLATFAHEAGHSTGHKKRLNRDFSGRFGSDAYAFEELVAELTAAMTLATLGVAQADEIDEQHAKYVASWLKVLKSDKRAIFTAAGKAQAATDLLLGDAAEGEEAASEAA